MDEWAALQLQVEWGADEALAEAPIDRFAPAPKLVPVAAPVPAIAAGSGAELAAAAADLVALHAAMDGFEACRLRATASRTVAPSGNAAAGLVWVAEAPGAEDDRSGQAFSGEAGARLDRLLGYAGLTREALLLTTLVPWRPPGGRPANEGEIAQCLPFVHRLLALARPRGIVLLGTAPVKALAGVGATTRGMRGKWSPIEVPGLGSVPATAMAGVETWLASAASRQALWADLLNISQSFTTRS